MVQCNELLSELQDNPLCLIKLPPKNEKCVKTEEEGRQPPVLNGVSRELRFVTERMAPSLARPRHALILPQL